MMEMIRTLAFAACFVSTQDPVRTFGEQGDIFLAAGRYEKALAAYQEGIKSDGKNSFCGTCLSALRARARFGEAQALEYLKRPDEAIRAHFKLALDPWEGSLLAQRRIVDLYEAAGKTSGLRTILDEADREYVRREEGKPGNTRTREEIERYLPARTVRRILDVRDLEGKGDWKELVSLVKGSGFPHEDANWSSSFMAMEAIRIIERHPKETAPLLLERLPKTKDRDRLWVCYALSRCGSVEALDAIAVQATRETNFHHLSSLVFSLLLAGEPGRNALEERRAWSRPNESLAKVLERHEKDGWKPEEKDPRFPPIPKDLKVPASLPK